MIVTGSHSSDDKAKQSLAQARRALAARASGWRTGRGKEEWPPVPSVRQYQIEAVAVWANMHRENRRPLTVAAPLLAIVCALYDKGHPLPVARRLADAIGCSKDGIDAAISMALAYDEVSERYEVIDGGVRDRKSVV